MRIINNGSADSEPLLPHGMVGESSDNSGNMVTPAMNEPCAVAAVENWGNGVVMSLTW